MPLAHTRLVSQSVCCWQGSPSCAGECVQLPDLQTSPDSHSPAPLHASPSWSLVCGWVQAFFTHTRPPAQSLDCTHCDEVLCLWQPRHACTPSPNTSAISARACLFITFADAP